MDSNSSLGCSAMSDNSKLKEAMELVYEHLGGKMYDVINNALPATSSDAPAPEIIEELKNNIQDGKFGEVSEDALCYMLDLLNAASSDELCNGCLGLGTVGHVAEMDIVQIPCPKCSTATSSDEQRYKAALQEIYDNRHILGWRIAAHIAEKALEGER